MGERVSRSSMLQRSKGSAQSSFCASKNGNNYLIWYLKMVSCGNQKRKLISNFEFKSPGFSFSCALLNLMSLNTDSQNRNLSVQVGFPSGGDILGWRRRR